jgi:hypothetical protein
MEQYFRVELATHDVVYALTIIYLAAVGAGMIIMAVIYPVCQDMAHLLACWLTGRTKTGHKIHRDHVDPRLETWQ